jgi:alkaline phosphatase D
LLPVRRVLIAAALAALAAAAPASGQAPEYGVAAGEVTSSSAILWTRAPAAGAVRVTWGPSSDPAARTRSVVATAERDQTVQLRVIGLKPGRAYVYRFQQGTWLSDRGRFRTAPRKKSSAGVRFAFSGDTDAQPASPGGAPFYNNFEIYGLMAGENNHFNINLGDTIYSDTEVGAAIQGGVFTPAAPTAFTLQDKWAKYRQNLSLEALQRMRGSAGSYSHWDDHEFVNDFSPEASYADITFGPGSQAFRDYAPVTHSASRGLYRKFRWGKHLELFFLDERSFRSAKVNNSHCLNPANNAPDLAPTAPQAVRSSFTQLVPALSQPVSPQCLAALGDPKRTMLGAAQLKRFLRDVKRSKATFKAIINETPLMKLYVLPYDRWEGYAAEREKVLKALQKVKGAVVLTTDMHANVIGELRHKTLESERPVGTGVYEVITGPVATMTYAKEIDQVTGVQGSWQAVDNLFFSVPPPGGLGLGACSHLDTFSYSQVSVTSKRLQVTSKDIAGKRLCDPLVVKAPKKR